MLLVEWPMWENILTRHLTGDNLKKMNELFGLVCLVFRLTVDLPKQLAFHPIHPRAVVVQRHLQWTIQCQKSVL